MDINQVRFGGFSIGANKGNAKSEDTKKEETKASVGGEVRKDVEPDVFFETLDNLAVQGQLQVSQTGKKEINPADYLSQDRIADIEAMMGEFENGVDTVANTIESEFPGFFSAETKNALAAGIFAGE